MELGGDGAQNGLFVNGIARVAGVSDQAAVTPVKEREVWEERSGMIGGGRRHCCNFLLDAVSSPCDDGK